MEEVLINLDKERALRFDGMAIARLERKTGCSIIQILSRFSDRDVPFHFVLAMLYAGLQQDFPGLAEEQILQIVDRTVPGGTSFERVMSLAPQCAQALAGALPKAEAGNPGSPATSPGKSGTGTPTRDSVTA